MVWPFNSSNTPPESPVETTNWLRARKWRISPALSLRSRRTWPSAVTRTLVEMAMATGRARMEERAEELGEGGGVFGSEASGSFAREAARMGAEATISGADSFVCEDAEGAFCARRQSDRRRQP